jgi:hypothetical protein
VNELRFQRRWAPIWWLTLIMAANYAFLAYTWLTVLGDTINWPPGSGIRVVIPLLAVAGDWLLACAANSRISIVRPSGIRLSLFLFPIGSNRSLSREKITTCYARNYIETNDSDLEVVNDYTTGVQTSSGQHFDVEIHFKTAAEALQTAEQVARVLNANPTQPPVEVRVIPYVYTAPNAKRIVTLWAVLTLLALAVGFAWDRNLKLF